MTRRSHPHGFTLPELMVSLAIGLVLVLVISTMVARQEDIRRGVSSSNELSNNVAYSSFLLDRELRNAGAGLVGSTNWGCPLVASLNNTQLLPSLQAFPAPFDSISQTYVIAPVVVFAGAGANGSDVLMLSTGNSGLSEAAQAVAPQSATAGQVQLSNTLGMRGGDLVLLTQAGRCMLQQVSTGFAGGTSPTLTFGGTYAADTIAGVALTSFADSNTSGTAFVSVLGNVTGNRPRFHLIGLNTNNELVSYDLLRLAGTTPLALVEGVVDLRVLYGVDSTGARSAVDTWVLPTAAGYTAAALTNGTSTAQTALGNILAVRVGLIIRSDQQSRDDVTAGSLTLFGDLGDTLSHIYTVPTGTTNQRYRAVEFTVPLRNSRF
ncbi:PilW family protein [Roseateles saccharophilus]|uniref:Prepilin-type N-terminal cleavage/methylation domain-containing protein n=1 Tax=Roseateles saccharophilus TaxID=304 RepID=A0A4R3UH18_ROSSA|nr:PilW family protein [Roseateles saccharophilus]MDG0834097.1 prepilin-type N-terminal cleavage/methylation domain-containing protein [Roseateles saccharophilus]TCU90825.1 prepilin-type N-terminal cleavage/methylation domain-containing protein [Roseateles saccharophilus]